MLFRISWTQLRTIEIRRALCNVGVADITKKAIPMVANFFFLERKHETRKISTLFC